MWGYLNHSNLKIAIDLNPFVWGFCWAAQDPVEGIAPDLWIRYLRFLPLGLILTIDSGRSSLILPDDEHSEEPDGDGL